MKPPPPTSMLASKDNVWGNILIEKKVISYEPQPFQLQGPLKPKKITCCSHEEH